MPSRVPMSSAARDGAEESGQRVPPTKVRSGPQGERVPGGVSHLAQLPSERPFPSAPQLQRGQQGRCKPVAEVRRAPTSPGLRISVCVKPTHTTSSSRLGEGRKDYSSGNTQVVSHKGSCV